MTSQFCGENKELWGFSLTYEGEFNDDISLTKAPVVKQIIDHAFEENMEIHVFPNVSKPCIIIKTPQSIWHYLRSREEAEDFRGQIMIENNYPCCQFL